jgi:ABC-type Mn2+/Zn2+ transport system permease subunit
MASLSASLSMTTMTHLDVSTVALSILVAIASGLMGSFALMRRMTLAADALSHVALPGIGVAMLLRANPLVGALAALLIGAAVIWGLEGRTRLATETVIGVVFSAALAAGAILTPGEELIDALFGNPAALSTTELVVGIAGACAVIAFILGVRDRLVVMFVSSEVARTTGIAVRRLSLWYLLAFALTVALGLRYLGALLMGSLIIIPAAAARQLARNLSGMLTISSTIAVFATVVGTVLATALHQGTGPVIVIVASLCFLISLATRRGA